MGVRTNPQRTHTLYYNTRLQTWPSTTSVLHFFIFFPSHFHILSANFLIRMLLSPRLRVFARLPSTTGLRGQAAVFMSGSPFSPQDLSAMRALLADNTPIPAHEPTALRRSEHVVYCFHQLARFAHLAETGVEPFRAAQYGLCLGRVQELLGCCGGKAAWWGAFEPLLLSANYEGLGRIPRCYLTLLDLPLPSEEFINKR